MISNRATLLSTWGIILFAALGSPVEGQQTNAPSYLLRYKLRPNEEIRYEVTHLGKTDTRIQGKEDSMEVRTVSAKVWKVIEVNPSGEMTFEHLIEHVEMTQRVGDGEELRWNSQSESAPPAAFEKVAATIGKPLCRVRINGQGQIKAREDFAGSQASLGTGDLVMPLPKETVGIGGEWIVPREIRIRDKEGQPRLIKTREVYTLEKVETGVATIAVRTEPLTPVTESSEKAQLIQQLSQGKIKFDLDAGRIMSKTLDWDEEVVGFQGAETMMKYLARYTEEFQTVTSKTPRAATLPARSASEERAR